VVEVIAMSRLLRICIALGVIFQALPITAEEEADQADGGDLDSPGDVNETDTLDDNSTEVEQEDLDSVWTDEHISSEQIRALHKKIDASADGKVSLEEMLQFAKLARRDIAAKDATHVIEEMDTDKDGKLSVDELVDGTFGHDMPEDVDVPKSTDPGILAQEENLKNDKELERQKFKLADKNGDGFLDKDELPHALFPELHEGVSHLTASDAVKSKDKNGDGELSPDEFWEYEDVDAKDLQEQEAERKAEFEKLDLDKNGKLSVKEYTPWYAGSYHTDEAMRHLFEIADEDGDHHLTALELDNARAAVANSEATSHMMEWAVHYEL